MIDRIEIQSPGQSAYGATNGQWMIGNGAIAGNRLTADLTGNQDHADFNGAMTGQFFGPAAAGGRRGAARHAYRRTIP